MFCFILDSYNYYRSRYWSRSTAKAFHWPISYDLFMQSISRNLCGWNFSWFTIFEFKIIIMIIKVRDKNQVCEDEIELIHRIIKRPKPMSGIGCSASWDNDAVAKGERPKAGGKKGKKKVVKWVPTGGSKSGDLRSRAGFTRRAVIDDDESSDEKWAWQKSLILNGERNTTLSAAEPLLSACGRSAAPVGRVKRAQNILFLKPFPTAIGGRACTRHNESERINPCIKSIQNLSNSEFIVNI